MNTATASHNQTKFLPPLSSRGGILRERQLMFMEEHPDAQIVLLLAPAGYGKTTLMGQWLERVRSQGDLASWLTLDAADNDPARLMVYLHGALREWLATALGPTQVALSGRIEWVSLFDRIGPDAPPLTLFLDEFEQLTATDALHAARLLLNHLPRQVRLVIGTRDKPQLGLERYRVRGELLELTAGSLRFDAAETQLFFRSRIGEPLAQSVIERMQALTEGWPAALQLTALASRTRADVERYAADLSGSLVHIADYLAEDVLNAQNAEIRAFLLETCGFPRLNAAACDAATGRTDSRRILQHLERHGLFTIALDTSGKWYRYHPLFAEFLRTQQAQSLPQAQIVATHRGAARWFARHGTAMEAVDLWLLANDREAATEQMAGCAYELIMQAQFGTISRWLARLDADALAKAAPDLLHGAAWAHLFSGNPAVAAEWFNRLKQKVAERGEQELWCDDLIAFESVLMTFSGEVRAALAMGLAQWERIGAQHTFAAGAIANTISYGLMTEGDFTRARQFADRAKAYNTEIGSALGMGYAVSVTGSIAAMQGNLDEALDHYRTIDKLTATQLRQTWFESTHVKVAVFGVLSGILYERDRLDEAEELLQHYLQLGAQQPSIDTLVFSNVVYSRLKMTRGDVAGAMEVLDRVDVGALGALGLRLHYAFEQERVRIELVTGKREQALARVDVLEKIKIEHPQEAPTFSEEICGSGIEIVRVAIARHQLDYAMARVNKEIAAAEAGGRRWRLVKLRLLRALALDARGDTQAAQEELLRAVQLGYSVGARRSFSEEGKRIEIMLGELSCGALTAVPDARALKNYCMELTGESALAQAAAANDALSERERSILRLLAIGMGNEQIASSLSLSVNTVKWHIRRILEKLQARNRSEAVFIANRRGLVAS